MEPIRAPVQSKENESPKIEHWYHIKEKADLPINPN